jgi:Asp-tRNA(Asn)/Glu-tRNA(Gln) amidotransferase A subunit family amidase
MSTIDFPSSVAFPALHTVKSTTDAAMVTLLKKAKGVQFGKTNVPEMACCGAGLNWATGMTLNPWGPDILTSGSSAGSGSAVASYVTTVAITEDTGGSTNGPALQNNNFGYDPPKFHYPNSGNPSLTVRNDQIGLNARSIDDIIAFDKAILRNEVAHAKAASYVAGLSNKDIRIGCSDIYYNTSLMSPAIAAKYYEAKNVLKAAGFTFVETCSNLTRIPNNIVPSNYSNNVYIDELQYHLTNNLKVNMSIFEVMLNGVNSFSTSVNTLGSRVFPTSKSNGCENSGWNVNKTVMDEYLGRVPAGRSDVYNEYYNEYNIDLVMGPTHYCDFVKWTVCQSCCILLMGYLSCAYE